MTNRAQLPDTQPYLKSDMIDHKRTLVLSPSLKGPYNWSQNRASEWLQLFHGAEEEHEKELP